MYVGTRIAFQGAIRIAELITRADVIDAIDATLCTSDEPGKVPVGDVGPLLSQLRESTGAMLTIDGLMWKLNEMIAAGILQSWVEDDGTMLVAHSPVASLMFKKCKCDGNFLCESCHEKKERKALVELRADRIDNLQDAVSGLHGRLKHAEEDCEMISLNPNRSHARPTAEHARRTALLAFRNAVSLLEQYGVKYDREKMRFNLCFLVVPHGGKQGAA